MFHQHKFLANLMVFCELAKQMGDFFMRGVGLMGIDGHNGSNGLIVFTKHKGRLNGFCG